MNVPALRFPEFEGGWEEVEFGDIVEFSSGGTPSKSVEAYWGGGIPWISAASMHDDCISTSERTVTKLGSENGTRRAVKDTVLLLVRGSMLFNRIPAGICDRLVTYNQDVKALMPKHEEPPTFVLAYIRAKEDRLLSMVTGTGIGAGKLDTDELKALSFCRPSLPEQKKIAAFLGVVDAKIAALRDRVAGLERYKRGLMQALFNQTLRFTQDDGSAFPDWEEKRLGEVSNCLDSKRKPLNTSERQLMQGEFPYYGANGQVDRISEFLFDEDLVLLAEDGGNFDEFTTRPIAQRVTGKCWVNNHAHILTAKKGQSTHAFLFYSLVHKDIRKYINGSSRAKLNKSDMLTIRVLMPHPDEQAKIAAALSAMDAKISAVIGQLDRMQDFKKALLQQMFV